MLQMKMSQIMDFLESYSCQNGQVITIKDEQVVPVDLILSDREDKANLILYAIYHIEPVFDSLYLENDITDVHSDDILTEEDFAECAEILTDYGVSFEPEEQCDAVLRWLILTRAEAEVLSKSGSLSEYLAARRPQCEELYFTHVYFDYTFTTAGVENTCGLCKHIRKVNGCQNLLVVNPAVGYAIAHQTRLLGLSDLAGDYEVLDGATDVNGEHPILDLCRNDKTSKVSFDKVRRLYEYIQGLKSQIVALTAENCSADTSSVSMYSLLGEFSISKTLVNLLALTHINTGKKVEFLRYAASAEIDFLDAVSTIYHHLDGLLSDRVTAFNKVGEGKLYFIRNLNSIHICSLLEKQASITFRVVPLESVTEKIRYAANKRTSAFDTLHLDDTNNIAYTDRRMVPPYEYQIMLSADNFSAFNIFTEKDLELDPSNIKDVIQIGIDYICGDRGISQNEIDEVMLESFFYRVLRLLEQGLFKYSKILTVADLICFESNGTVYIGYAEFVPKYKVSAYYGGHQLDKSHRFTFDVDRLIPASVLSENGWQDSFFSELLKAQGQDAISRCAQVSDRDTVLRLLSYLGDGSAIDRVTRKTMEQDAKLDYSPQELAFVALHKTSAYHSRCNALALLSKYFQSYGMRDIPISRATIDIYGDICSTGVYPISFVGYSEGENQ